MIALYMMISALLVLILATLWMILKVLCVANRVVFQFGPLEWPSPNSYVKTVE